MSTDTVTAPLPRKGETGLPPAQVLVVDDEPFIRGILASRLRQEGCDCTCAAGGREALAALAEERFDLVLADIHMPGMSGMELLAGIREHFPDVAVIMVTALRDHHTAIASLRVGAYGYVIKPFQEEELLIQVANALERRRLTLASRTYEKTLEETVRARTSDVRCREEEIAQRLAAASEFRDEDTGDHIRRIGAAARETARALGWDTAACDDLQLASTMHDVGKIGVPDGILLKTGKLTREEFQVVQRHTQIGASILMGSSVRLLRIAGDIALSHHEKWDGSGYPHKLAGDAIPVSARIVALADVYDALTHDRPYRTAMPHAKAMQIVNEGRGCHFDPELHDIFVRILPKLEEP